MTRFRLSKAAENDLARIWRDTKERHNEEQADRYVRAIDHCFAALAEHPLLGQACEDIRGGYRRFPSGEHLIYYRTEADAITVMRIRAQRMNTKRKNLEGPAA